MGEVTEILEAMSGGEVTAAERLLELVYAELRSIAVYRMAQESPGHTLQPTALVHEAWMWIQGHAADGGFRSRGHFFASAAEAMRRILVESARRKRAQKRGCTAERETLLDSHWVQSLPSEQVLGVDEGLVLLAEEDATAADLVKLRYFVGMSMPQAADALGLSLRSAERLWSYARAWLRRFLEQHNP